MKTYTKRLRENAIQKSALFPYTSVHIKIMRVGTDIINKEIIAKLIKAPLEGMSANEIRELYDEDLLDMDYFMHIDNEFFDEID